MKKRIFIAALAALSLAACTQQAEPRVDKLDLGAVRVEIHESYSNQYLKEGYKSAKTQWQAGTVTGSDNVYSTTTSDVVGLGWKDNVTFKLLSSDPPVIK